MSQYVHDAANRLITATVGSTTWTYAYGPLDRRVSKADGTNTIQYLYDNDRAVAEYNGTGTLLRKYIYGPGLDEPIMMIVPGDPSETVYYYHYDNLGSVIGLTNDAGAWVEKYAYTLYGKPAALSTVGNPYMYTGRRLDTETGLYYYRARYYDPNLRRFIETDPIGYAGGMNLYVYVGSSPVNYIDPWGLKTTVLITSNTVAGVRGVRTHAAFFVENSGNPKLYDPAGSYAKYYDATDDIAEGKYANLDRYVKFHNSAGTDVYQYTFDTTAQEEATLVEHARYMGAPPIGGLCARFVSVAISEVGPFPEINNL